MAFEVYIPHKGRRINDKKEKQAIVSLSKYTLVLNKFAREQLNATNIELAYDPDTNTIRISPSEEGMDMKKTKVYAAGFFKQFGIMGKGKFAANYDQGALYVDLNQSL